MILTTVTEGVLLFVRSISNRFYSRSFYDLARHYSVSLLFITISKRYDPFELQRQTRAGLKPSAHVADWSRVYVRRVWFSTRRFDQWRDRPSLSPRQKTSEKIYIPSYQLFPLESIFMAFPSLRWLNRPNRSSPTRCASRTGYTKLSGRLLDMASRISG